MGERSSTCAFDDRDRVVEAALGQHDDELLTAAAGRDVL
jgi:hypothetical protein